MDPEEYLADGFNPQSLTMPKLRSILIANGVNYSASAKKSELVQSFLDRVWSRRESILSSRRGVVASSRGVEHIPTPSEDGETSSTTSSLELVDIPADPSPPPPKSITPKGRGRPRKTLDNVVSSGSLTVPEKKPSRSRRSSSHNISGDEEMEPVSADERPTAPRGVKRPSSSIPKSPSSTVLSAGPALKKARSRASLAPPVIDNFEQPTSDSEDEPQKQSLKGKMKEEVEDEVTKQRKGRRVSLKENSTEAELRESGYSDYNPFQSGGETPDEASRKKRRKSSTGGSSSRRQSSAQPTPTSYKINDLNAFHSPATSESDKPPPSSSQKPRGMVKSESVPASLLAQRFMPPPSSLLSPGSEWRSRHSTGTPSKPFKSKDETEEILPEDNIFDESSSFRVRQNAAGQIIDGDDPDEIYRENNDAVSKSIASAIPSNSASITGKRKSAPFKVGQSGHHPQQQHSRTLTKKTSKSILRPAMHVPEPSTFVIPAPKILATTSAFLLLLFWYLMQYSTQSASIGFCDHLSSTNSVLSSRRQALSAAHECVNRHVNGESFKKIDAVSGQEVGCDASAIPLLPFLRRPDECAPCPVHAICQDGHVISCTKEYILKHSLFESLGQAVLDGLPGVGPVAFPPACVADTEKRRLVGQLAQAVEKDLEATKGDMICEGTKESSRPEAFAVDEDDVRNDFMERRSSSFSEEQFIEIFNMAIDDLIEHGELVAGTHPDGKRWLAATKAEFTLSCRAKLMIEEKIRAWRSQLAGTAAILAAIAYLRSRILSYISETAQVKKLVQIALSTLREKELSHYSDPSVNPEPYIAPVHLRDMLLPPTASLATKQRIWSRVEQAVKTNSNVQAKDEEGRGGDIVTVWEWIGVNDPGSSPYKRVTFEGEDGASSLTDNALYPKF